MFKERYHNMNRQISPEPELVNKMLKAAKKQEKMQTRVNRRYSKPIIIIAIILVTIFTATPVLAANVPSIYGMMYLVSPSVAQYFMPVQKSCIDNGIKMEVVSAYIEGDTAKIYVSMQDLEADRIDATTDLYDSYEINRPFNSTGYCNSVGYNEETKTVTFLVTISQWGKRKIEGDKITFSVREFLSGKHHYKDVLVPFDLSKVSLDSQEIAIYSDGSSNYYYDEPSFNATEKIKMLKPTSHLDFPVEGVNLTGIGYIGDRFHVQVAIKNRSENDNHGYVELKDSNGKVVQSVGDYYFIENQDSNKRVDYFEYIFDIPYEQIGEYSLYADYYTSSKLTKGNWRVTFPLEQKK